MPETVSINEIKIGNRFRKDMGNLQELTDSISEIGLLQPVVISEDNRLVAGHRRLEACKLLGWTDIPVNIVNLKDIVRGEFDENAVRKDFSPSEIVAIKRALEPIERAQAKERQLTGRPSEESAGGTTRERIASCLGVSHDTVRKAESIVKAAEENPEKYGPVLDKVDRKELSVSKGYEEVTEKKARKERQAKDFVLLPADLFESAIEAIGEARDHGEKNLRLLHDGHQVRSIGDKIKLATS